MTTDYDALSDEQLAVLVAEKVFGYEFRTHSPDWDVWYCRSIRDKSRDGRGWYRGPGDSNWTCQACYGLPMNPATSWADAGRVLERMREGGWSAVLNVGGMAKDPDRECFATFMREGELWDEHQGIGASLPRAICIAALKAVDA